MLDLQRTASRLQLWKLADGYQVEVVFKLENQTAGIEPYRPLEHRS